MVKHINSLHLHKFYTSIFWPTYLLSIIRTVLHYVCNVFESFYDKYCSDCFIQYAYFLFGYDSRLIFKVVQVNQYQNAWKCLQDWSILSSIRPKYDNWLFLDFCVFTHSYLFLPVANLKLFWKSKQNRFKTGKNR